MYGFSIVLYSTVFIYFFVTMDQRHDKYRTDTYLPPNFVPLHADKFDPEIWGPHYWFFLETISHTYPQTPNSVTKRKYYDFIQNLPLFIPNPELGDKFSRMLDDYPVSPYLDSRDSFIRWVHFIHNKLNHMLGKPEISLFAALDHYRAHYKPKQLKLSEKWNLQREYVVMTFTVLCLVLIYIFYQ
jgi:hypothetical protein